MLIVAILFVLASVWLGLKLTKGRPTKQKWLVWGLLLLIVVGPSFSWLSGIGWGIIFEDGFAGMGMMIFTYAGFFVAGLVALVVGLLKKDEKIARLP